MATKAEYVILLGLLTDSPHVQNTYLGTRYLAMRQHTEPAERLKWFVLLRRLNVLRCRL